MPKENTNMLEGMKCPACGSLGPFNIESKTVAEVFDYGVEDHQDIEWEDDSACVCGECSHAGTVATFSGQPAPAPDEMPFTVVGAWTGNGLDEGVWNNSFIYHVMAKNPLEAGRCARMRAAQDHVWPAGDEATPEEIREQFRQAEVVAVYPGHIKDVFDQTEYVNTQLDLAESMLPEGVGIQAFATELERLMPDFEVVVTEVQFEEHSEKIPAGIWQQALDNVRAAELACAQGE